eukprot:TRINITY_DN43201_c0_g1_i1.p1 TRINITY_DN43201_c0_g1~~TRINITY_DN43201_c0_g1_i1.p1  ORF type:complete len:471 (+),score=96.49 TRINITY_DN43201_c0_g1_i1:66-1478(+)
MAKRQLRPVLHGQRVAGQDAMDLALKLAQVMSKGGSSAKRNHDTVECFLNKLGFEKFSICMGMTFMTLSLEDGGQWQTRAVQLQVGLDLQALVNAHNFVRDLKASTRKPVNASELYEMLQDCSTGPHHHKLLQSFLVGITCACIFLLIGGDPKGVPAVLLAATAGLFLRQTLHHDLQLNIFLAWVATSYVTVMISSLFSKFVIDDSTPLRTTIAPTLMLIPGVPIVNSVIDLVRAHYEIGVARFAFVSLLIMMQGYGVLLAELQVGRFREAVFTTEAAAANSVVRWVAWQHVITDFLLSGVASLGFACLFQVSHKLWPLASAVGCVGHGVKTMILASMAHMNIEVKTGLATFTGTSCMVLVAHLVGGRKHLPALVLYVPGIVLLVPGAFWMQTALAWMWIVQNYMEYSHESPVWQSVFFIGFNFMLRSIFIVGGVGFGVAVPTLLLNMTSSSLRTPSDEDDDDDDDDSDQ